MLVSILSMQQVNNTGSLLQAYALKKRIEQLGNTVSFLQIRKTEEDDALLPGDSVLRFGNEAEKQGIVAKLSKIDRYAFNRLRIKRQAEIQNTLFDSFRREQLEHSGGEAEKTDCCVIGSDEVFNCLSSSTWGFSSQLFGNIPEAGKIITYAASCGPTRLELLPAAVKERIRECFRNISAFSVRDSNTHNFVSGLTGADIEYNLDPVLIYDFSKEIASCSRPVLPERYCIVYSYYNRIHDKDEIRYIKDFCRKNDLTPVAVGAPQKWIRGFTPLTPFQVLYAFRNASFVITDTFHGAIFSALYSDRFAVITRPSNENKLGDLVSRLDIGQHLIRDMDELDRAYAEEKDAQNISRIIERETEHTLNYLRTNIADEQS